MNELKPCPFCGGAAEIVHARNYYVWCDKCETRGDWYSTEAEAVKAWNTRAERTCRNTSHRLDESRFHCSECEFGCWVKDVADGRDKLPSHCPNCGARVVEVSGHAGE